MGAATFRDNPVKFELVNDVAFRPLDGIDFGPSFDTDAVHPRDSRLDE